MSRARVTFLCHGAAGSPAVERARAVARRLADDLTVEVVPRRGSRAASLAAFSAALARSRPDVAYVVDVSPPGVVAALAARRTLGTRVVVDTGDAVHALAKASAMRGRVGLALTWATEELALRRADRVVTRGSFHAELLRARGLEATAIPDGVDVELFAPRPVPELRQRLAGDATLVVGLLGSLVLNRRTGVCYGWDLIEALAALRDLPVRGLIVGDGDGLPWLRSRATALGVHDRVTFVGRMPLHALPPFVNVMDVALSTQTNDLPGQVRTTGKLPIYLAAGRFVLATRVGEAARVLDEEQLLDFEGDVDPAHVGRLAARLRRILAAPELVDAARERNVALARARFGYDVVAAQVRSVIRDTVGA